MGARVAGPGAQVAQANQPLLQVVTNRAARYRSCMLTPVPQVRLVFRADGHIEQHGVPVQGGQLTVIYDLGRLPDLRRHRNQVELRSVEAHFRFLPGNTSTSDSLLEPIYSRDFTPVVVSHRARPVTVTIPRDASTVEIWFRTHDPLTGGDERWDSRFGQNYPFAIAPA
jgi:hypothetical protein